METTSVLDRVSSFKLSLFSAAQIVAGALIFAPGISTTAHATPELNDSAVVQAIQKCARTKLHFAYRQDNLSAHYEVTVNDNLTVNEAKITHSSGDQAFDGAVLNALKDCPKYPEKLRSSSFSGVFNYTR